MFPYFYYKQRINYQFKRFINFLFIRKYCKNCKFLEYTYHENEVCSHKNGNPYYQIVNSKDMSCKNWIKNVYKNY